MKSIEDELELMDTKVRDLKTYDDNIENQNYRDYVKLNLYARPITEFYNNCTKTKAEVVELIEEVTSTMDGLSSESLKQRSKEAIVIAEVCCFFAFSCCFLVHISTIKDEGNFHINSMVNLINFIVHIILYPLLVARVA